jgi:hypothetical protein
MAREKSQGFLLFYERSRGMKKDRKKDLDTLIEKHRKKEKVKKGAGTIDLSRLGILKSAIENYANEETIESQNGVTYKHMDKLKFAYDMEKKYSSITEVTQLPFVRDYTKEEKKTGRIGRNFWSVKPTGDYLTDCETGHEYAAYAYAYMQNGRMNVLAQIVFDIMQHGDAERDKGLIVGFFYSIYSFLMGSGGVGYMLFNREISKTKMNVLLHNERVKKESKKLPLVWNYPKSAEGETGRK